MEIATSSGQDEQASAGKALAWAARALAITVWASGALFAAYILAFYIGAIPAGTPGHWNAVLPRLHVAGEAGANWAMGVHFVLGSVLLLLGPVQFIAAIRQRAPLLHRLTGRLYLASAALTGLGGLTFIALRGTVGGAVMDVGFGLYGALMLLAAGQALRHALARRLEAHRAWAIRLFALVIGSWLYRMEYALWFLTMGEAGHTEDFRGAFDQVMAFAFYLPNLLVAEAVIRSPRSASGKRAAVMAGMLWATAALLALATWFFTTELWWPAIVWRIGQLA